MPEDESHKVDQALKRFVNATEEGIPDGLKEPVKILIEIWRRAVAEARMDMIGNCFDAVSVPPACAAF